MFDTVRQKMSAGKPIVQVLDAGRGETPACPEAKFKPGDVVKVRRFKHLMEYPEIAAVAVVVPPGFPAEYALADAHGKPRPLMITKPRRCVSYICGFQGDTAPVLFDEKYLRPSGEPPADVKWAD